MKYFKLILISTCVLLSTACMKRVVFEPASTNNNLVLNQQQAIDKIGIGVSEGIQKKIDDEELPHSEAAFRRTMISYLNKFQLYSPVKKTGVRAQVELRELRVRSYASAAVLGMKSGPDFLSGKVVIYDADNTVMTEFVVSVSNLRGGIFHGQDSRFAWLERAFSQQIALQLSGNN